ncbi:MAG: right-handed parallel beta-helix repeat-containing protein [Rubripirellula sp.]|nr:right-handed parallel beta-helix repeat-containing protein [Rubripirellula sp.]
MIRTSYGMLLILLTSVSVMAEIRHVPGDFPTIQAAIDASAVGDTVLVAPGRYEERIRLITGVTLKSEGNDQIGVEGMKRAEATILDGGGNDGDRPGVAMAENSVLDGFTVTAVGQYDDVLWQKHFDSKGEQLGDDEGSVQAEGTVPAIAIRGISCTVTSCIVHHNGDVGIGILGSSSTGKPIVISKNTSYRNLGGGIGIAENAVAIIQNNRCKLNLRAGIGCRAANPMIIENECFQNVRAGIGCREGARPIIRENKCFQNRRAGIGIRMKDTTPIVEGNECYENEMAGIGSRDHASPILKNNLCHHNKMAGIGCDGSTPLIVRNECRDNQMAGIGLRMAANAFIHQNQCHRNKLVAIGITQGSTAMVTDNDLSRNGGAPPLIAVKDGSVATIQNNRIAGGGVAGILVQGKVTIHGNQFQGAGKTQGNAIWVWEGSTATITNNQLDQYRAAVNASKASVNVTGNTIKRFQKVAIIVKSSTQPPLIHNNHAISSDPNSQVVDIKGMPGVLSGNEIIKE